MADNVTVLISGARIIDPANGIDAEGDILIERGHIAAVGSLDRAGASGAEVIEAKGLVACPGFVDIHCHLREPGPTGSETVLSGSRAAVNGGYTTVCAMPNTDPPVDSPERVAYQKLLAARAGYARVLPVCAVTAGRRGEALVEMTSCAAEGAVAFSDDGDSIPTAGMLSKALAYAKVTGLPIIEHAEDASLVGAGLVHKGGHSTILGLPGMSASSEDVVVARDCIVAGETGGRLHIAHVSTSGAAEIIRRAKAGGTGVTAEVTPHHLTLDDCALESFHTSFKMKPPLRSRDHVEALRKALLDGTIDCIATDHAPHRIEEKELEFDFAPFGVTGLETNGLV
ncbi:MAG: dihydroorotase [Planctomycetota bacterium]|jgi:dihydroorotase